jgi:hypothetical protein
VRTWSGVQPQRHAAVPLQALRARGARAGRAVRVREPRAWAPLHQETRCLRGFHDLPPPDQLIPDAPELVEWFLASEQDASARRNAFLMLCACAQDRAVAYLLSNVDRVAPPRPLAGETAPVASTAAAVVGGARGGGERGGPPETAREEPTEMARPVRSLAQCRVKSFVIPLKVFSRVAVRGCLKFRRCD